VILARFGVALASGIGAHVSVAQRVPLLGCACCADRSGTPQPKRCGATAADCVQRRATLRYCIVDVCDESLVSGGRVCLVAVHSAERRAVESADFGNGRLRFAPARALAPAHRRRQLEFRFVLSALRVARYINAPTHSRASAENSLLVRSVSV
jgi:hypothetical protein